VGKKTNTGKCEGESRGKKGCQGGNGPKGEGAPCCKARKLKKWGQTGKWGERGAPGGGGCDHPSVLVEEVGRKKKEKIWSKFPGGGGKKKIGRRGKKNREEGLFYGRDIECASDETG